MNYIYYILIGLITIFILAYSVSLNQALEKPKVKNSNLVLQTIIFLSAITISTTICFIKKPEKPASTRRGLVHLPQELA
jgi:sulfur relay (sulfurtransferase) complex TusBCD TusD component (DsrE family)